MLINDKIIFDHYFCRNFAQTKEIMVHCILFPRYIFLRVKAFILMLIPSGPQLLIVSTCIAWHPVTSINKCGVLTARAHVNWHINTRFCLR